MSGAQPTLRGLGATVPRDVPAHGPLSLRAPSPSTRGGKTRGHPGGSVCQIQVLPCSGSGTLRFFCCYAYWGFFVGIFFFFNCCSGSRQSLAGRRDRRSPGTPAGLRPAAAALRGAPRVPRMPRAPSAEGWRKGWREGWRERGREEEEGRKEGGGKGGRREGRRSCLWEAGEGRRARAARPGRLAAGRGEVRHRARPGSGRPRSAPRRSPPGGPAAADARVRPASPQHPARNSSFAVCSTALKREREGEGGRKRKQREEERKQPGSLGYGKQ